MSELATYALDWTNPATMDDDDLRRFVKGQYLAAKLRRQAWESRAAEQMAWVDGDQDLGWSEIKHELDRIAPVAGEGVGAPYYQPQKLNRLQNFVVQRVALLLGRPVVLQPIPNSDEDSDIASSATQQKLLQYMFFGGDKPVQRELIRALCLVLTTGIVVVHPHWDPYAGQPDTFSPKSKKPVDVEAFQKRIADSLMRDAMDPASFAQDGSISMPPGLCRWSWYTGFDVSEPEFCTDIPEADWLILSHWRSMEWLKSHYGEARTEGLKPEGDTEEYLATWRYQYGTLIEEGEEHENTAPELILVHTLWRPVRMGVCPKGAMIVVAGCAGAEKTLHKGPNPYPHGEIPAIRITERDSQKFRPGCMVADLIDLQKAKNKLRAVVNAGIHATVAPKIMTEVALPADAFDQVPRLVTVPDGALAAGKIRALEQPTLPASAFLHDQTINQDMEDIATVHPSTQGRSESSGQSGKHAAIMVQNDSRANFVLRAFVDAGLSRAANQSMWIWWKFCPSERTIVLTGEGLRPQVLKFKGADLLSKKKGKSPTPGDWNVRVLLAVDAPVEQVIAEIDMLTERGWLSPERLADRMWVSRRMGEPIAGAMTEDERQRQNAQDENRRMLVGGRGYVVFGDHDDIHIDEHGRETTTAGFRDAVRKDRGTVERMAQHIRDHELQRADKIARPQMLLKWQQQTIQRELDEAAAAEEARQAAEAQAAGAAPPGGVAPGTIPFPVETDAAGVPPAAVSV